jgi:DNA-binding transcriptional MerR regulator
MINPESIGPDEVSEHSPLNGKSSKSPSALKTISEAAEMLDVPQHVLRFWETKFAQIKPLKRNGGRRYYRPEDIEVLQQIKNLLYRQGYTIKGAKKAFERKTIDEIRQEFSEVGLGVPAHKDNDNHVVEPAAVVAEPVVKAAVQVSSETAAAVAATFQTFAEHRADRAPLAPAHAASARDLSASDSIRSVQSELKKLSAMLRSRDI